MVQIRRKGPKRSEHVGMQKGANFSIVSTKVPPQNRGVMVTPKKSKFLQLCEHQIGVQLTLLSSIFTPKWCKYDLYTILNVFKNTFAVSHQH